MNSSLTLNWPGVVCRQQISRFSASHSYVYVPSCVMFPSASYEKLSLGPLVPLYWFTALAVYDVTLGSPLAVVRLPIVSNP